MENNDQGPGGICRRQNQFGNIGELRKYKRCQCKRTTLVLSTVCLMLALFFIAYIAYTAMLNRYILQSAMGSDQSSPLFNALTGSSGTFGNAIGRQKGYLNIGMRQDYLLQECQGSELKQSFPDLDYAFLGYNILKGYPLSVGHDPGFTYPIFIADYSEGTQTADCRYSVPKGLLVIPDVSCETSFSSTVAQTKYEFATSMSASANVGGGGWGVHFSASAGYKTSSSEIATGEYVYIISSATCSYYFSKLLKRQSPILHPAFIESIQKLSETNDKLTYLEFFDDYGTHFPTAVTFGARFTYEYKMKSETYEMKKESSVDVAVQASYSGLFSVSGGFGMSSSDSMAASEFSKSVETRTITTGAAPPSNGDAMTWASTVKTSPVPIKYKLESIEKLFTNDFMAKLAVNKTRIVDNIRHFKNDYCKSLKEKGLVSSCAKLTPGIQLMDTRLMNHYQTTAATLTECIDHCLKQIHCSAITYCTSCTTSTSHYKTCYMYRSDFRIISAESDENWQSHVFLEKIKRFLDFNKTVVKGIARTLDHSTDKRANSSRCRDLCIKDANCVAFSHCECLDKTETCELYGAPNINGLIEESNTQTTFMSQRIRHLGTTTSTETPTTTKITGQSAARLSNKG